MTAKTPLERAFRLLAIKARTGQELDRALAKAKVPQAERETTLARLRELGYINDREVARGRARTLIERGEGPRLLRQRLAAQGIAQEDAAAALAEARGEADEDELAVRALRRRLKGRPPRDEKEKRRLFRALIAKGHKAAAAAKALGMEWDGDEEMDG